MEEEGRGWMEESCGWREERGRKRRVEGEGGGGKRYG